MSGTTEITADQPLSDAREAKKSTEKPENRHPVWRVISRILTWFVTIVMLLALALGVVVGLIPALHNGKPLTVLTGSMEPTFNPGDTIVVYKVSSFDQVKIGDIITFEPKPDDPTLISHRLVGWTTDSSGAKMAITKGDNNSATDDPIYQKQMVAKYQYRIPKLGYLLNWGADQFTKPRLLIIAAGILILYSAVMLISTSFGKDKDPKDEAEPEESTETPAADDEPLAEDDEDLTSTDFADMFDDQDPDDLSIDTPVLEASERSADAFDTASDPRSGLSTPSAARHAVL
jgi:signal peptidase